MMDESMIRRYTVLAECHNDVSLARAVWLRWTKKQGGDYLLRVTVELAKICKLVLCFFVDSAARTNPVDSFKKRRTTGY
eukprot:scaffold9681_cov103-Skeletonema_dohrnii-CCMP3373.AAC.8